jgi:uncharacterized protein (TIGR02996 family)
MPRSSLSSGLQALADGQPERALSLFLEAWRTTHHPRLASAIELLSHRLTADRPPPFDLHAKNPRQEWLRLAAARTDMVIPWLVSSLVHPREDVTEERLVAMARWPADPRIARAALQLLLGISGKDGRRNGPRLLALLGAMADPRFIDDLAPVARMQRRLGRGIGPLVRSTVETLQKVSTPSLPEAEVRALEVALAALGPQHSNAVTIDLLFAAVYADPAVDAPRQVLADALQEQGFPRGEFIALQLARATTQAAPTTREAALLKRWSSEWLAPYQPHFAGLADDDAGFGRGFLRAAKFRADAQPPTEAWRTVETIDVEDPDEDAPRDLLSDPAFSSVREVLGIPLRWVDACVTKRPMDWARVDANGDLRALEALTRRAARLPSLQNLRVSLEDDWELGSVSRLLFSAPWAGVRTRSVSCVIDLSLTGDRLAVTLWNWVEQGSLDAVVKLLAELPARTLLLQTSGTLRPGARLALGSSTLDLTALGAAAKQRGLQVLLRTFSAETHEVIAGAPVDVGSRLLSSPILNVE